jgi:DNA invertase Pin-like site-specific DNA recombinase
MTSVRVAIYARVSSDQQVEGGTVASQLAALQARLAQDGARLEPACRFVDEGYSGATLVRPGLERLRDLVATGTVDRVYVHAPDRLARRYAYQVLLLDEFRRGGAEVVFLNRPIGVSPEDDLLLQVQGMVAEYERAQILERSRRGKRHAARRGAVSVLSTAPYGYRYTDKRHGGGVARYEVVEDEAAVVRQMFGWLGHDRVSIGEVCRRLRQAGRRTRAGVAWQRGTVWRLLKNPAYAGRAAFGKTRAGPLRPRLRPIRGSRGAAPPVTPSTRPSGSASRCRPSSIPPCSRPFRSSSRRTGAAAASARAASGTCCGASRSAGAAGTGATGDRAAGTRRPASRAATRTIAARAPTATASAGSGCATTRKSGPISSRRPSGARWSGCCAIRAGSRRNTRGASAAAGMAASRRGTWRPSRPSCKGCGAGSAG